MRDALAKDARIHRDLSVANIVLVKEADRPIRKGYLIDWEASCRVDEAGEATSAGRFVSDSFRMAYFVTDTSIGYLGVCIDPDA